METQLSLANQMTFLEELSVLNKPKHTLLSSNTPKLCNYYKNEKIIKYSIYNEKI